MKENELRKGNWIRYIAEFEDCYIQFELWDYQDMIDNSEAIPLTEEILSKCGFEIFFGTDPQEDNPLKLYNYKSFQLVKHEKDMVFIYSSENSLVEVKYLHQLQNLVFALTGEELTIEL